MYLLTTYVATSATLSIFHWLLHLRSFILILLGKWPIFNLRLSLSLTLNLRLLPLLLLTQVLFLQWARSNMVPLNLALEANNFGRILDLSLALILVALGLVLDIWVESKSTLVIRGFLHTQNIIKCGFPFMTFLQVFLQGSDLGLELFDFLYMVSSNTSARGGRSFIIRATRQSK